MQKENKNKEKKCYKTCGQCLHVLTGRISAPKICIFDFECYHCLFDQWLENIDPGPEIISEVENGYSAIFATV